MDEDLKMIALEYIKEVNNVCLLMLKGLNLNSREEMLNHRIENPIGEFELDGRHTYQFHGRGCKFSNRKLSIDWDFGIQDKWCGLNPWLLADYIQNKNKKIGKFQDGNDIKKEFENAILKGEMEKKYDLYYIL